jgi:hypothetical protein
MIPKKNFLVYNWMKFTNFNTTDILCIQILKKWNFKDLPTASLVYNLASDVINKLYRLFFWFKICIPFRCVPKILKVLLTSSYLFCVCPHKATRLHLEGISWNLISALLENQSKNFKIQLTLWHKQPPVRRSEPPMSVLLILAFCQ